MTKTTATEPLDNPVQVEITVGPLIAVIHRPQMIKEEVLRPLLEYSRQVYSAGGPAGWQQNTTTMEMFFWDIKKDIGISPGIVPRIAAALREHGYQVTINDMRGPGPQLDVAYYENCAPGVQKLLKIVEKEPRGQIEVRGLDDAIDVMHFVAQAFPHAYIGIADARTLRLAWDHLAKYGGHAPGPNNRRYTDLASAEVWDLCRCLARAIRTGTYRPSGERIRHISKGPGRGMRRIALMDIEDRVVQRAITIIMQPFLDSLFDPHSYGYRPGRNHLHALAFGEHMTLHGRRCIWVADDLRDAFVHVPLSRLLQVFRCYLPDDALIGLLEIVLPSHSTPGLRQGGSLSPLSLNLYLHHLLDRPWRRAHSCLPLIRFADDLLIPCRNEAEAHGAYGDLCHLLHPTGLAPKGTAETAIQNLDNGAQVEWLGFSIAKPSRGLSKQITEGSWERLSNKLALAHFKRDAPLQAIHIVSQWLNQRGPAYPWCNRGDACRQIAALAEEQGFEEIPDPSALTRHWQLAFARWQKPRRNERHAPTE